MFGVIAGGDVVVGLVFLLLFLFSCVMSEMMKYCVVFSI